jgi:hypothetical protein
MEWVVILIILLLIVGGWGGVHVGLGMAGGLVDLLFLVLVIAVIVWLVRVLLGRGDRL